MPSIEAQNRGPQPSNAPFGERTVHIDMASDAGPSTSNGTSAQHNDVAGVLRRNQACLQCRKRKLTRPHCATCVRSYRHLLRTNPKSNPVLCCDYDDGNVQGLESEKGAGSSSTGGNDEDDGGGKKKRKASGEGRRKKKDEEFEEERDRLTRKIEQLQAQLTGQQQSSPEEITAPRPDPIASRSWSTGTNKAAQPFHDTTGVPPSPNTFLEMLHASGGNKSTGSSNSQTYSSGLMGNGPMWGEKPSDTLNGFNPMFNFNGTQQEAKISPGLNSEESRRSSLQNPSPPGVSSSDGSSAPPNILSPNGVFNFSPGPSGLSEPLGAQWPVYVESEGLQPSTKVDGPWRGVETVESVFTASINNMSTQDFDAAPMAQDNAMETEINLDDLQAGLDAAMQQQLLMDLFWPGWPMNLPEPNVVNDLIEAFFNLIPNIPRLLNRARFLARMTLPPTHSNFPHPALIHAICAAAAAWCAPEVYEQSPRVKSWSYPDTVTNQRGFWMEPGKDPNRETTALTFGLRQAALAKDAIQDGLNTGNRLFDVVRAMIILCRVFIDDTRMLECWAYGGLVARMLLPLGLHVRSAELSLKSVMLPPPADALEREERRAAVWMAFYHDTIASAASGWGTSMSLDELTVPLPVAAKEFEMGNEHIEPNPQDIESHDLWVKHPVVDSFVMVMKASVLLNRVNKFVRKWKNRHLRDNDDFDGMNKPEFRELANAISCFQMSFPAALRDPTTSSSKKRFDIDLIAAHMIPHAATIFLYEPFADVSDPGDHCTRRMKTATQAIVSVIHSLASNISDGHSGRNFTSVMHSSASVCLVTSARTSLLFLRQALNDGDMAAAQTHRTDCEIIRMALSQFGVRFKIGHHHAQLIEYFMDRTTNPTYEKMCTHYPEHPRPGGAIELTPTADLGLCAMNAINVKRGFWRVTRGAKSTPGSLGTSPFGSTPDNHVGSGSTSTSVSVQLDGDSPYNSTDGAQGARRDSSAAQSRSQGSGEAGRPGNLHASASYTCDVVEQLKAASGSGQGLNWPSGPTTSTAWGSNHTMAPGDTGIPVIGNAYPGASAWQHVGERLLDPETEKKFDAMRSIRADGHMSVMTSATEAELAKRESIRRRAMSPRSMAEAVMAEMGLSKGEGEGASLAGHLAASGMDVGGAEAADLAPGASTTTGIYAWPAELGTSLLDAATIEAFDKYHEIRPDGQYNLLYQGTKMDMTNGAKGF
ncbi:hypothetical protein IAU60_002114 [Kwoniella sp. DSM 27419]